VCVCCFVLLYRYWGIVTVPGSIPYGSRPGVAGSSPFTLTTSVDLERLRMRIVCKKRDSRGSATLRKKPNCPELRSVLESVTHEEEAKNMK